MLKGDLVMKTTEDATQIWLYDWLDDWLEVYAKPTVKERTYLTYYYSIKHVKCFMSDKPL